MGDISERRKEIVGGGTRSAFVPVDMLSHCEVIQGIQQKTERSVSGKLLHSPKKRHDEFLFHNTEIQKLSPQSRMRFNALN
jgi:hypothetical protein